MKTLTHMLNTLLWYFLLLLFVCSCSYLLLQQIRFEIVQAETFTFSLPIFPVLEFPSYWTLHGYDTNYKNDRLKEFQNMLKEARIPIEERKWYVGQLLAENGALNETSIGDHGCSFGIIQYNACSHAGVSARRFLLRHPEWMNYRYQLRWMTDAIKDRRVTYKGNVQLVVLDHNSPYAASHHWTDTRGGYLHAVKRQMNLLTLE